MKEKCVVNYRGNEESGFVIEKIFSGYSNKLYYRVKLDCEPNKDYLEFWAEDVTILN